MPLPVFSSGLMSRERGYPYIFLAPGCSIWVTEDGQFPMGKEDANEPFCFIAFFGIRIGMTISRSTVCCISGSGNADLSCSRAQMFFKLTLLSGRLLEACAFRAGTEYGVSRTWVFYRYPVRIRC